MSNRAAQVEEYGWGAVPINPKEFAPTKAPTPQLVKDTPLPDTQVAKAALEYAKAELPAHTFNHSMRVFYYGTLSPYLIHSTFQLTHIPYIRPRNRQTTLPRLEIQRRNLAPHLSVPRHRDYRQVHTQRIHVL